MFRTTPGITEPNFTELPLGTEGEMTFGPDDYVPYDDPNLRTEEQDYFEGEIPGRRRETIYDLEPRDRPDLPFLR